MNFQTETSNTVSWKFKYFMLRKCGNYVFRLKVTECHLSVFPEILKIKLRTWKAIHREETFSVAHYCPDTPWARQCSAAPVGRSKDSGVAPWVLSCDWEWGCYWNRAHTLTKRLSYILKPPVTFLWQLCGPVHCTVWETLSESWSKCSFSTTNNLCDLFSAPSSLNILLDFN